MSDTNGGDRRLRAALDQPVERAEASAGCPDDEHLWRAAHREITGDALATIVDHVAECESCTESWRMARTIGREAGLEQPAEVLPFYRRRVVRTWGSIAAGLVLAALLLPVLLERQGIRPVDTLRDPTAVALSSSLDEAQPLARDAVVLRWSGAPEGTRYTVELADTELVQLLRSPTLDEAEYTVPADTLATLPDGATLYWRVDAVLPDGTRVTSQTFPLRIR